MKELPGNQASGPRWGDQLINDLSFIKQKLRYPISKRTVPGLVLLAVTLFFIIRTLWITYLAEQRGHIYVALFLAITLTLSYVAGIARYMNTLRFRVIATPYPLAENMKLVDRFLREQQLNLYRHPQAPEVYQILSRPMGRSEQREVMIFIADDERILVNSHFTNQKWLITPASKNAGRMANRLRQWIAAQGPRPGNHPVTIS